VEDEEGLADLYGLWLADEYDVRTAYSGEEALDLIDADVDAILLDRRMPGLSGDEVLTEIRNQEYDCPVAMVSAVTPDFEIAEMPFDAYLRKPIEREQLQEAIDQLLLLGEYDDQQRELFALAQKKATLEAETAPEDRDASPEYAELTTRLDAIRDASRQTISEMDPDTLTVAFSERT
jgi:DNA-binding response OmpR family regulator